MIEWLRFVKIQQVECYSYFHNLTLNPPGDKSKFTKVSQCIILFWEKLDFPSHILFDYLGTYENWEEKYIEKMGQHPADIRKRTTP